MLPLLLMVAIAVHRSHGATPDQGSSHAAQGQVITYTLNQPGFVSAAVYDGQGRMVRPLLYGEKQDGGSHTLPWDGLDRYGQPQPQGAYEWRVLRTPGFKREFLVNLGTQISWAPFDYWPGNHFGPSALLVDELGDVYVGSVSSEGPPHVIKMTQDGARLLWTTGTYGFHDGLRSMARVGEVLYVLSSNGALDILRADKGGKFHGHPKLARFANAPFANLLHEGDDPKNGGAMSLAAGKDFLVATDLAHDEVRLLWPQDDAFVKTESVAVSKPVAAAMATDGRVFVVSANRIVCITPGSHATKPVVDDPELKTPGRLTYDPAGNDLIVVNGNHLRRYSAADGKLIAIYGRPDGRTYGIFNPLDFDTLLDVAADGRGGFFTAEANPRRVAHFKGREKHELVQQWIGGMAWGWQALLDPENPAVAYMGLDARHLGRGEIDYAKKTWTLTHLYDLPEWFSWGANGGDQRIVGNNFIFPGLGANGWQVRHANGSTYLVHTKLGVAVVRVDEKENRLVPVARIASLHPTTDRRKPPAWWISALKGIGIDADSTEGAGTDRPKAFEEAGGYKHFAYSWSDTNRNGRVDIDEIHLGSVGNRYTDMAVDEAWNIYFPTSGGSRNQAPASAWSVVPNEGKDKLFPEWNWDHEQPGKGLVAEQESRYLRPGFTSFWVGREGDVTATVQGGVDWTAPDLAPISWPNNATSASRLMRWDRDGRQLFSAGVHTQRKDGPPGGFSSIRSILGQARGNIVVRDACAPATVWTPDGLYAGTFYSPRPGRPKEDEDGQPVPNQFDDAQDGQVIETPKREVLWGCNDVQNTLVYRVHGWDGWEQQSGKVVLGSEAPSARRKGKGLAAEFFANPNLSGEPALRREEQVVWFGPMWGSFREVKARSGFFQNGEVPDGLDPNAFSARWSGFIEPPVSEEFRFVVFAYGAEARDKKGALGSRVRLWVDGKPVVNSWDDVEPGKVEGYHRTRTFVGDAILLHAGKRVPVRLEYSAVGGDEAHIHLYWESRSFEMRHIPQEYLYGPIQADKAPASAKKAEGQ